jgi:hypothetical protein
MHKLLKDWTTASRFREVGIVLDSKRPAKVRRDGRVAEGARLESVYTARYPGFESLSLRQ